MIKRTVFLLLVLSGAAFVACSSRDAVVNDNNGDETAVSVEEAPPEQPKQPFSREIGDSKGVIVLTDKYGEEDTIRIYNRDGTPWYEFSYYDESAFDELESINTDFRPFAFHPDYLLLGLRVVGDDDTRYEVVVNEVSDIRKFVRKDDENLAFEEFEKHILSTYAVDFDPEKNPLRKEPGGEADTVEYGKVAIFKAERTDGDWLEVSWTDAKGEGPESSNSEANSLEGKRTGWVRWRKGTKLLIALYYVA